MPQIKREQPQVIQAENVVGVLVGEEHCMDEANFFPQKLLPQIGRGVDQQIPLLETENHAAAGAVVARVFTGANRTLTADRRHPHAGSRPQNDHLAPKIWKCIARGQRRGLSLDGEPRSCPWVPKFSYWTTLPHSVVSDKQGNFPRK